MAVESEIDRLGMLSDFGLTVTAYRGTAEEVSFTAIFDEPHALYGDDLVLSTSNPQLVARSSDVASVVQDADVHVEDRCFTVSDVQPDGTGITVLQLSRLD